MKDTRDRVARDILVTPMLDPLARHGDGHRVLLPPVVLRKHAIETENVIIINPISQSLRVPGQR